MKYKITVIRILPRERTKGIFKAKRRQCNAICPYSSSSPQTVEKQYLAHSLFETAMLPAVKRPSLKQRIAIAFHRFDVRLSSLILSAYAVFRKILNRLFGQKKRDGTTLRFLQVCYALPSPCPSCPPSQCFSDCSADFSCPLNAPPFPPLWARATHR